MIARWRILLLIALFIGPILALAGFGAFELWRQGWSLMFWFVMASCFGVGYYLAWRWQSNRQLLTLPEEIPIHWTDRDRQAWKLVEAKAQLVANAPQDRLVDATFYLQSAQEMSLELARFFSPGVKDPVGSVTIPEILSVIELASHDLSLMTRRYLPGGHLLTVDDWRRAKQAQEWYQKASNIWWGISALFSPFQTGARYLATRAGLTPAMQMLQRNLVQWFFTAYVHRMGHYLIELYSGRLRVGATRYRELQEGTVTKPVTLTLFGQVKAGKSSLINALLGDIQAVVDVLPSTSQVSRYTLRDPARDIAGLVVLDTVGYGHQGPRDDQLTATETAAKDADVMLLVLHSKNPARQADVDMLDRLKSYFDSQPSLKMPPVIAVLTHIDLLSPMLEWQPPYNWEKPTRPKETSIAGAVQAVTAAFGDRIEAAIPVCTEKSRVYGIDQFLLPALSQFLNEASGVRFVRTLRQEADEGKYRQILDQLLATGSEVLRAFRP